MYTAYKTWKIAGNYYPTILFYFIFLQNLDTYLIPFLSDLSITPGNVGANTYNTAIAFGEKAAVIIAEDLGIKGVTSE